MARIEKIYGTTVALSSTAAHKAIPRGYTELKHSGPVPYRLGLAPSLERVFYYTAATGAYADYTPEARDGSSSTHVPLDGMLTTDILYMGFSECPRGAYFDIGSNANSENASLDVEYWNGSTWTDVAGDSDGTISGSASLAVDGLYTWTLPASVEKAINNVSGLHWIRFKPTAALSATVDINEIIPACIDTNYGYFEAGVEYLYPINIQRVGAIEAKLAAGTATLNLTCIKT